jgi:L-ascorbate 6-phosphate lactonase
MNTPLVQKIRETKVEPGSLAIFWIAQAGFVFKTPTSKVIYIDPYLSNCVNRLLSHVAYGFKRLSPSLIEPEEVEADLVACTHSHPDHFDYDAIPVLARNPRLHFAAAPDCRVEFEKLGIPPSQYTILAKGQALDGGDFKLTGVYADHGELAPHAQGFLLQVGDIKVWQVGDTAYRPDQWLDIFQMGIDVLIPPINGAFGNLDGVQAAKLARDARVKVAIPCHFWMFAEHGGSPAQFMDACKEFAPAVRPLLMSQGESFIYHKVASKKR